MICDMADRFIKKTFIEGDKIITKGEDTEIFYILRQGSAKAVTKDGTVVIIYTPGMYFGERSIIEKTKRSMDIVSCENTFL
mmetsp:Transcript_66680/g.56629  ORF Transcript_66680/g.56629 Transcript_66680/m.56629 type:complete len:81 (-) Transcript_66680:297-539(-)